jgi:hypothetical protein
MNNMHCLMKRIFRHKNWVAQDIRRIAQDIRRVGSCEMPWLAGCFRGIVWLIVHSWSVSLIIVRAVWAIPQGGAT